MAVYTSLQESDIVELLEHYELGRLTAWNGIEEGVENSNFFLRTTRGQFILTLFEKRVEEHELPYFMKLMAHLEKKGIHCPCPIEDINGKTLRTVKERPAVILTFMEGKGVKQITQEHMPLVGWLSAAIHKAGADFLSHRNNAMSFSGWRALADRIYGRGETVMPGLNKLIKEEMAFLAAHWPQGLPAGTVHADLFPDNVFFEENKAGQPELTGVIDFYFACNEQYMYDLAITMNAWCFDEKQKFIPERAIAMFKAYDKENRLMDAEKNALPVFARGAALRFLLTRAHDKIFHPPDAMVQPKDPMEYVRKLEYFRKNPTLSKEIFAAVS